MSTVIYDINGNIVTSIDESPEMIVNSAGAPINPSTSDLQTTANTDISSINTKTPALGQALAATSVPVVLTAAQLATLTPPTTVTVIQPTGTNLHTIIDNVSIAVTGTFFQATQPVSIASPVAVTGGLTDAQLRASPVAITGSITATNNANGITGSAVPANATQVAGSDGTNLRALKVSTLGVLSVDGSAVTQPVSIASPVAVTGALTNSELRASAVPVSIASSVAVTGTFFQATQPVSGTVTANLGTIAGVATETTLNTINTKVPTGLTVKAASIPAVATDQALVVTLSPNNPIVVSAITGSVEISNDVGNPIPVNGTVTISNPGLTDTQLRATPVPVSGTVSTNGLTDAQLRASAVPVSLTSTTITSSALPTGASTNALQTSGNSTLSSIDTKTPALGQALAAASTPVVLTAAQIATLTPLSSISISNFPATQPVSGTVTVANPGLTDTQLRATAVPVSLTSTTITGSVAVTGTVTANLGTIAGVATESTLNTLNTKVPTGLTIKAASTPAVAADQALVVTLSPNNPIVVSAITGSVEISNDVGNPIPVSGTVTATISGIPSVSVSNFPATQVISAVSLPLPTGAATEATLSTLNGKVTAVNTGAVTISTALPAGANTIGAISNTAFTANAGTNLNTSALNLESTQSAINAKIPSNLTVTATRLLIDGSGVTQPVSGTVAVSNPGLTDTQLRATALPVSLASTTVTNTVATTLASTTITGSVTVTGPLTDAQIRLTALPVSLASTTITNFPTSQAVTGAFFQATQPVSAASLPLPTGAATETTLSAVNSKIPSGLVVTTGRLQVELPAGSGGLTDTQLRATAVPVSLTSTTVTNTVATTLASTTITGTVAISSVSLPLPTGASTSAGQTTTNASLSSIDSKLTSPLVVSGSVNVNRVAIIGSAPATSNITTTSAIVVPANASRKGLTIINLTNTRVFLSFEGNTAVVNSGIMLANGGSFSMDNFSFTLGAVRAIVASGTTILSIQEFA